MQRRSPDIELKAPVWAALGCALLVTTPASAAIESPVFAKSVSNRLNMTGRDITMPVPLKVYGIERGEVMVRIRPDDSLLISKASLVAAIASTLDDVTRAHLDVVAAGQEYASLETLRAAGFPVRFDPGLQELTFSPLADQRPTGEISLGHGREVRSSEATVEPAFVSGFLNVFAGFDYTWGSAPVSDGIWGPGSVLSGRFDFESALRIGGVIIENRALYGNAFGADSCPLVVGCTYGSSAGFQRELSRLIYDLPESAMRLELGDVDPLGVSVQRAQDLLGISLEKSDRKLNPGKNIAPVGQTTFRIDRPSTVEVMVNSVVLQRLHLPPGNYNVRDLPLATGSNQVDLSITDDAGNSRVISSTTFFDAKLLAAGMSEWGIALGAPSYFLNEARTYAFDLLLGTAFLRYGLSDDLTALGHLQSDAYVTAAGADALRATPWGLFGFGAAASTGELGTGAAATLTWSRINVHGLFGDRDSVIVSGEYRSPQFHTPGEFVTTQQQVLLSQLNYALRLDASYSAVVGFDTTATLSARLQLSDAEQLILGFDPADDNRYGADITLSRPLAVGAIGSLTLGFSNETYLTSPILTASGDPEFRIAMRINVRPDEETTLTAGYDTLNDEAVASAYRSSGDGLGRWDASINTQRFGGDDTGAVTASAGYYGNRSEVRLMHSAGLNGVAFNEFYANAGSQRTSLRVGTALAFAGEYVGVGAPVRGGAFAVVYPHESIADKDVIVGSADHIRAKADGLGPAVVSSVPAYARDTIPVDVADLPLGYSLGTAAFDTYAPYRAGYDLQVGSAYSVVAYGRLLSRDGTPLALLTGEAHPEGDPMKRVAVFTNRDGKFAADGVAPGRWILEMATQEGRLRFALFIPQQVDGLHRVGELRPDPEA